MERVGWLYTISKGFWSVSSGNTFGFGLTDRALKTGRHAMRFFEEDRLGQIIVNRHIRTGAWESTFPEVRVMLDDNQAANKLSVEDIEELRFACQRSAPDSPFSGAFKPFEQWVKAFYSPSASCWVNVRDDVFIGQWIAKITRIVKHDSL